MQTPQPPSAVIAIQSNSNSRPKAQDNDSPSPPESPPKDAAYLKRREQVRRAQRTHRERKENYIKALELQIHDLRTSQREIARQNAALTSEVEQLRELVKSDSVDEGFAGGCENAGWMVAPAGSTSISNSTGGCGWVGNDMWQVSNFGASAQGWSWQGGGSAVAGTWCGHTAGPLSTAHVPSCRPALAEITELDYTDVAVEFVMSLKKPCINRATSTVVDVGEQSVDYVLQAPGTSTYHTFLEDKVLDARQKAGANGSLEKLLALSENFNLEGELTPIQAWQQIVSHPQFSSIGIETMRRLVEQLLWHVKCYGFGAVIKMSIFKELFKSILAEERRKHSFGWDEYIRGYTNDKSTHCSRRRAVSGIHTHTTEFQALQAPANQAPRPE